MIGGGRSGCADASSPADQPAPPITVGGKLRIVGSVALSVLCKRVLNYPKKKKFGTYWRRGRHRREPPPRVVENEGQALDRRKHEGCWRFSSERFCQNE